jgi:hypothetical protein
MSARLHEIARCRVDDRAAADAIATTVREIGGMDVEVRPIGEAGFLVIVEGLAGAPAAVEAALARSAA